MSSSRRDLSQDFWWMVLNFLKLGLVQVCLGIVLYLFIAITTFRYVDKDNQKWPDGTYTSRENHNTAVFFGMIWPIYWSFKGCYHSTDFLFESKLPTNAKLERDR